jgi:urease accessory protein UreE
LKTNCPRNERGAFPPKATYARLLKPAPGAQLRISAPRLRPNAPPPTNEQRLAVEAAVRNVIEGPLKSRVRIDETSPDMIAWIDSSLVRFMPNGNDPAQTEYGPSVSLGNATGEALETAVARALLRARQVLALQRFEAAASGRGGRGVRPEISARRFSYDAAKKQCAFRSSGEVLQEGQPIGACDQITITIENNGRQTIMPAVFFLDGSWNVFPRRPKCPIGLTVADRLEPGRRLSFDVFLDERPIGFQHFNLQPTRDGVRVKTQAEFEVKVLRITACAQHGSPFDLTRAAYHLGNRHVPIELKPDHLKIEPDHVLADMLRAMHMTVVTVQEAFEPEGGAYSSQGHSHGAHSHGDHHAHDH